IVRIHVLAHFLGLCLGHGHGGEHEGQQHKSFHSKLPLARIGRATLGTRTELAVKSPGRAPDQPLTLQPSTRGLVGKSTLIERLVITASPSSRAAEATAAPGSVHSVCT